MQKKIFEKWVVWMKQNNIPPQTISLMDWIFRKQDNSKAVYKCHIDGLVYHYQCPDGCFQVATPEELTQL